jgi:peptide/nickel transport system permease protein
MTAAELTASPATSPGVRNRWIIFLIRRAVRTLVAMLIIVTAAFLVLRMAGGDPVRSALGPTAPESVVQARRHQLGLDQPWVTQYFTYLKNLVLHGNLGVSLITGRSVDQLVSGRLPATAELAGIAFGVVLVAAIGIGLVVAVGTQGHRRRWLELVFTAISGFFAAVPEYLLAVVLVVAFAISVKLFPVAGQGGPGSYVLPVLALAAASMAALSRIARVEALNALKEDYVRTARAKRVSPWRLCFRHVLPNMLTATLTLGGTLLSTMIASSVLVEQVFNWPGMGTAFVQAIETKDYGIVQGLALVYAAIILVVNFAVDVLLALLDRRTTLLETA